VQEIKRWYFRDYLKKKCEANPLSEVSETQKNTFGFGRYLMRLLLEEGDIVPEAKLLKVKPKRFKLAKEMTSYLNLYLPRA
jgi:hypothetical protein